MNKYKVNSKLHWMGTTVKTAMIPIIPANPDWVYKKYPIIKADRGADHMWWIKTGTRSNLFTSLATKLTILPGAVSPRAVLLNFNAWKCIHS